MPDVILETEYHVPPASPNVVARSRLSQAIEGQVRGRRLVLVCAPAGYGKTTLLADWAHQSRLPIAWVSLTKEQDNVERFFRYLLLAWQTVEPAICDTPLGLLLGSYAPDLQAVLPAFLNAAAGMPDHLAFVLDDYHVIDEVAAVGQALAYLLDHLPEKLHFVVSGRSEPRLPLARYRARGQLLELGAGDLRFTLEESAEFLDRIAGLAVSPADVSSLHAGTEGWAAGLQLAALGLVGRPAGQQTVAPPSGRQRFIADYLAEDVLDRLPGEARHFLLCTSILDRMSGPLCQALVPDVDGQAMLERLERENLFVVPLDDRREWFRYHGLFGEFLQAELQKRLPGEANEMHARAARWFLEHNQPEPAFQHAITGQAPEIAAQIAMTYTTNKLAAGEIKSMQRWVDAIPEDWYAAYPALGLVRAGCLFFTGFFEAAIRRVDEVEQRLVHAENQESRRVQLAQVTAVRCMIACSQNDLPHAVSYASQALQELPKENLGLRPGVFNALGDTYRRAGRWQEARESYQQALAYTDLPSLRVHRVNLAGALADLALMQGGLRDAYAYWRSALATIEDRDLWGSYSLPVIGWVFIRLSEILYEWDRRTEAADYVQRGLERAELGGDARTRVAGYLLAGRLSLAQGEIEAATAQLERARLLLAQAPFPDWGARFRRLEVEIGLTQDRLNPGAGPAGQTTAGEEPGNETDQLTLARVLTEKGDAASLDRARTLLERLFATASREGRKGVAVEALALGALAAWRQGDRPAALTALERTLRLADPEGYVRLFVDLGLDMARLLQEAHARNVMRDYVATLLAAFGRGLPASAAGAGALPEPLTGREQEILALLAAGLTNREIADRLVISPETAKKHTGNIFAKLEVGSRTQAVARARELDLLT